MNISGLLVSLLAPLNQESFYALVIQPYKEGAERVNRAFLGKDPLAYNPVRLSWENRIAALILGTALLIPMVNAVIWVAMKTFAHPIPLSDPYMPK